MLQISPDSLTSARHVSEKCPLLSQSVYSLNTLSTTQEMLLKTNKKKALCHSPSEHQLLLISCTHVEGRGRFSVSLDGAVSVSAAVGDISLNTQEALS